MNSLRFKNTAAGATLYVCGEIVSDAKQQTDFRAALSAVKSSVINVEINSPGGDVFAGIAILNMLKASGKTINVKVMGIAASIASLIAMAGDTIEMPANTFMMIHNPWCAAMGNANDLRETADVLDKIGASILATYVAKTGMPQAEMKALLAKDTWLTADEAVAKRFATVVTGAIEISASVTARAGMPQYVRAALANRATAPRNRTASTADIWAARR